MIKNFLRDETGLELSEYAVAAALIAIAVVGVFGTPLILFFWPLH